MPRWAAIFAIAFLIVSCAPQATSSTPSASPAPPSARASPVPARAVPQLAGRALERCAIGAGFGVPALCGDLVVPEDPGNSSGRTIGLRVAVIPAARDTPEPDPVFMLAGGPGGSAVDGLAWTASTFLGTHLSRDIVLVDQRGTGGSNAMLLEPLSDVSDVAAEADDGAARAWVSDQFGQFDADPAFYTTSVAMDDLDAVRAALGYDRINLWGGSYGATAAQYYLRQHGDRVRAMVLDGATLLEVPVFERIAANSQAALDALVARCGADAGCSAAYPDVAGDLHATLASLEGAPVTLQISDPRTGEPAVVRAADFAGAVHSALLDAEYSAMLPWFVDTAAAGRWEEAVAAAQAVGGGDPFDEQMPLMSAIIRCSEAWAVYDAAEVGRLGRDSYYLGVQLANARLQERLCEFAPAGVVPVDDTEPATSGEAASERFPNSATVIAEGHGHTVSHLGCLPGVVDAFFAAGSVDGLDTACVHDGVPLPPFRLP